MNVFLRLLFLCLLAISGTGEAFLASIKHAGMGVTGAAYAQDAESGAYNPANIVDVGTRIDIGMSMIHSHGKTTISGNANPALNGSFNPYDLKNFYNPHFGVVKQIRDCWAASLVCYNKSHIYTQYPNLFPLLGTSNLRVDLVQEIIAPMIAYKPNEYFSFGFGVNVVIQKFNAYGIERMRAFSVDPSHVSNNGNSYSHGANVCLGMKFNPFSWLSIGASWQPKIRMTRFREYSGFLAQRGRMDHPETINGGIMIQPIECVHIVFDVQYIRYSRIPSLHNRLSPNFPVVPGAESRLGGNQGSGFGWNDATILKCGIDYDFNEYLTVRAGYRHGDTPFDRSQNAFNLADDEVTGDYITGGATWRYNSCFEISFYTAFGLAHHRSGRNSVPPLLGGGEVGLSQSKQAYGLSIGRIF